MQSPLSKHKCAPCKGQDHVLNTSNIIELQKQLSTDWKIIENHHLEKSYLFKNFQEALAFTNKIGALAEQEGHHPDIFLSYGKVTLQLWTHKIKGLSENDFILAAKIDDMN